ncbi:MATE domain protein [Bacteroides ovatus]|nr:MATE domain protein [Bacteroides ovatus]
MKELDLTQGSVPKVLLQFAVPFLIANVLQALYGGADLFVVGQYDDSASVAAVAIGSQVMQTITGIILGITTGTTVLIAIATGAKDNRKVAFTIGSSVWLFSITGVVLTLVMVLFHSRIAELMHTPVEAMVDTKNYILVCSLGILFIVGYNVVCGILRGLGDSKTPLYFVGLACVINIVLDFILVGYFHWGAYGSGYRYCNCTRSQLWNSALVLIPARIPF